MAHLYLGFFPLRGPPGGRHMARVNPTDCQQGLQHTIIFVLTLTFTVYSHTRLRRQAGLFPFSDVKTKVRRGSGTPGQRAGN